MFKVKKNPVFILFKPAPEFVCNKRTQYLVDWSHSRTTGCCVYEINKDTQKSQIGELSLYFERELIYESSCFNSV